MIWDRFEDDRKHIAGKLKDDWHEWTGDEPSIIAGMHDQFGSVLEPQFADDRVDLKERFEDFTNPRIPRCR